MFMPPLYRDFTTQQQIDDAYDPMRRIADAAAMGRHFEERGRQAREQLPCVLGVPFGPTLDETLDIFPAAQRDAPVFVFVHGGYWRARTARDFSGVALGPHALGMTTVVLNYSLCPKVTIDEIVRQVRAGIAWVVRHIAARGGDPRRIVVGGHSAGAHLAAMSLQTRWEEEYGLPRDPVAAAVLVSGLYDIEPLRHSFLQPAIQLDDGIVRRNSPAFSVRPCATPLHISWGGAESEEFARQSRLLHEAWQRAGNRSELAVQPGADHFTAIHGFEDPASGLCRWLQAEAGRQNT